MSKAMRHTLSLLAILVALGGCAEFPELDAAISDKAKASEYPSLVPAETILADTPKNRLGPNDGAALLARAERLRKRGEILRGLPVIDEAARLRFSSILDQLGG